MPASALVRWQAVQRLARKQDDGAREVLVLALTDPSAIVRWRAALALGRRHDVSTLVALRKHATDSPVHAHRASIWDALSRVARSSSVLDLGVPLQAEDDELRQVAVETVGRFQAIAFRPQLLSMIQDVGETVSVRYAALCAVARMPTSEDACQSLAVALRDACPLIRAGAARAVGQLDCKPLADAVNEALQDEDGYVRCEAAKALGRVGERQHIGSLKQALTSGPGYEAMCLRRQAWWALWRVRWRQARATIVDTFVATVVVWPKRWLEALKRAREAQQKGSET